MATGTVFERVKAVVVNALGAKAEDVHEESSFTEDLGADSLDLVELIMALEEEFFTGDRRMEISDDDAGNLTTVKEAVKYIEDHMVEETADV